MNRLTLSVALGLAGVIGCTNQQTAPEPQTGPPGVDIEYHDRDEAAAPKAADTEEPDNKTSEAKPSKADESNAAKSESQPAAAKKSCTGLKKNDCQVTMGCAWSTDKVCVNQ